MQIFFLYNFFWDTFKKYGRENKTIRYDNLTDSK